jgi:hypothetical protein
MRLFAAQHAAWPCLLTLAAQYCPILSFACLHARACKALIGLETAAPLNIQTADRALQNLSTLQTSPCTLLAEPAGGAVASACRLRAAQDTQQNPLAVAHQGSYGQTALRKIDWRPCTLRATQHTHIESFGNQAPKEPVDILRPKQKSRLRKIAQAATRKVRPVWPPKRYSASSRSCQAML